jgi:hypothetical protein
MTAPIPLAKARLTGRDKVNPERFKDRLDVDIAPIGSPPSWLDADQKKVWCLFRAEIPWLTEADRGLVEIATRLRSRMMHDGWEPSVAMLNLLRSCIGQMGGTPVDRSRIKVADEPPADAQERHFG